MSNNTKPARKKIKATDQFKAIMEQHFREADSAAKDENQKVAWCTSVGPAELLTAFGFKLYFPENHAAMLGTTRLSKDYIPVANAAGSDTVTKNITVTVEDPEPTNGGGGSGSGGGCFISAISQVTR